MTEREDDGVLTRHFEPKGDGVVAEFVVDAEGNVKAIEHNCDIVVIDPLGQLPGLHRYDTTGYYDDPADDAADDTDARGNDA